MADVPRRLATHPVQGAHEVSVRDRMRRLLGLPDLVGVARRRRGRVEDDLCAVEPEEAGALGFVSGGGGLGVGSVPPWVSRRRGIVIAYDPGSHLARFLDRRVHNRPNGTWGKAMDHAHNTCSQRMSDD